MRECHEFEPIARRAFTVTPYAPDAAGVMVASMPSSCSRREAGDPPCRLWENHRRDRMTGPLVSKAAPRASTEQLLTARRVVRDVYVDDRVKDYIVDVVFATREPQKKGMKELAPLIEYGASPRASIALNLAARAHAFVKHRGYVTPEDVKAVGPDVLRHRIILTYEAEAEEITSEQVVKRIFETVEVP